MLFATTRNVIVFVFLTLILSGCDKAGEEAIVVDNLRCEMLLNPEGIDAVDPRLSWNIFSEQRDIQQSAYQILVASSQELLANNEADLWNSGKVFSNQSVHVNFAGKKLKSRQRCYWKVKVWSEHGESEWGSQAYWSMGLLNYKDWEGRWIGFDRAFPWDKLEKHSRLSARNFRKEFETKEAKKVKHATVYIMGLGMYELYINGEKAGDQVLAPSPTDYTKNVKYNSFDVTDQIREGQNAIGTVLGNGMYFTMRQNYKPYKIKNFGFPKMLLNLHIEYTDGSSEVIRTDNSWKGTADGPIRSNNIYDGEEYDAHKEMPGWSNVGFDDSNWIPAEYVQEARGEFEAQMNENMKVMRTLRPVSITKRSKGRYVLDFGQNMAGWLRFKVSGNKGDRIVLKFGESLLENGELFLENLRDAKATDVYILKGGGEETWEPRFVYHGFRYVEVSGFPGVPEISDFEGCLVYDKMPSTGHFKTSDSLINQIYQNAFWSINSAYKGIPVDCPQRNERMPWLGDRAIGCYGESFVLDNSKLYLKWLDDIRNTQKADGSISDVAPAFFRYYSDNMTWPGTYILVAEMLYQQYALVKPIKEHYPHMKKWLKYMQDRYMKEYILTKDSYGDWCAPLKTIEEGRGKSANVKHPNQLISTAYFYHYLQLMQEFAKLSGNSGDIAEYNSLAEKVKQAFNEKFFDTDSAIYGTNTLTDNLLPLFFDMIPEKQKQDVLENISHIITIENKGHLSSGLVGVQWLMRSLSEHGMADLAFQLATNTTFPSWGYMVENGATTIWELWNANTAAPVMNSQNHVMLLGDLIIWYYENLAGIKSSRENPGFKKIIMNPSFYEELDFVNASYNSVYGKIVSHWTRSEGNIEWHISIPPNTNAQLTFPMSKSDLISEDDEALNSSFGINKIQSDDERTVLEIGSGTYNFKFKSK